MTVINKILFPVGLERLFTSWMLLIARIVFGGVFMVHGLNKWTDFQSLSRTFPDPVGVGSQVSLGLAIFAELLCPIAIILGFLYRLALLPMLFTMIIAFFVIHGADPFDVRELSFLYLAVFALMLLAGPGRISIDALIGRAINRRKRNTYGTLVQSNLDYSR